MLKSKLTILFILLFCGIAWGQYYPKAKQIQVDASTFDKNLSPDDTDVQKALITVDEMTASQWGDDGSNIYFNSGDVGIGTTSPFFKLDVGGIINGTALYVNGVPYLGSQWTTNGTSIYYNDGNVGIGTSTPSEKLEVYNGGIGINDYDGSMILGYTSAYPPAYNSTYVKATTTYSSTYYSWHTFNPTKSLVGLFSNQQWLSSAGHNTNQRLNVDLGSAKKVERIYYENSHSNGDGGVGWTGSGAKNFTLWGSNSSDDFASTDYNYSGSWVQIPTAQSYFDKHISSNSVDPKYITLTNSVSYRYYSFKIQDSWGGDPEHIVGLRRIELQEANRAKSPYLTFYSESVLKGKLFIDGEDSDSFKFTDSSENERIVFYQNGDTSIPTLTDNGFVKTSGGDGTLGIDTNTYLTAEADTLATVTARGNITNQNIGIGASSPNSQLEVGGSFSSKTTIVSGNTTLDATHHKVIVTNTATITLPTAVGIAGREYNIISGLVGSGTVTISTTGGQTIRGDASLEMYDRGSVVVISDGTNWERGS